MNNFYSRVTVISVGVDNYIDPFFQKLRGVVEDLKSIRYIFSEGSNIALYKNKTFIELYNPSSDELRKRINEYVMSKSADGDILIFYFSGHGVSIGRDDFGFCTKDTIVHPLSNITLPLSVVKFSEVLHSIYVANITPVIIIDACYSGIVGKTLRISPLDAISIMHDQLNKSVASSYCFFCACTDNQGTIDTSGGGIFSHFLYELTRQGISPKNGGKAYLKLLEIYPLLVKNVASYSGGDIIPRLYIGKTLPEFPLCRNVQYSPQSYSLSNHLLSVLEALWNNGKERSLSPHEINLLCGQGAYGNHNKLSLPNWMLGRRHPPVGKKEDLHNEEKILCKETLQYQKQLYKGNH